MQIGLIHQFDESRLEERLAVEHGMGVEEVDLFAGEVNAAVKAFVIASKRQGIPVTGLSPKWGWIDRALGDPDELDLLRAFIQADAELGIGRISMSCSFGKMESAAARQAHHRQVVDCFRAVAPDAERAGVDLCVHTTTRPGIPFGTAAGIDAFLADVGSERIKLLFCSGCIAVAGWDVPGSIRHWRDEIGAVHLFNPRGDWDRYDEMRFDLGQVDMVPVLKTLKEVGYDDVLLPHEYPAFAGPCGEERSHAWTIGYLRAMLQALESE